MSLKRRATSNEGMHRGTVCATALTLSPASSQLLGATTSCICEARPRSRRAERAWRADPTLLSFYFEQAAVACMLTRVQHGTCAAQQHH